MKVRCVMQKYADTRDHSQQGNLGYIGVNGTFLHFTFSHPQKQSAHVRVLTRTHTHTHSVLGGDQESEERHTVENPITLAPEYGPSPPLSHYCIVSSLHCN